MRDERLKEIILNTVDELNWHTVTFVFKVYPSETYNEAHKKVISSVGHFPYQIHSFNLTHKQRFGDWGHLVKQTVELGLYSDVTIEEVFEKFNNVVHLQQYEIVDKKNSLDERKKSAKV